MKKKLGFILLILMIVGCASQKSVRKDDTIPPVKDNDITIDESFDPTGLKEEEIQIKKSRSTEAKSNFDSSILNKTETLQDNAQGYRVQICAVSDEFQARDIQKEAILKFNEKVYLIYDSPYYKVRVGNCTTRYDADQLQKLAEEKGFADSWVVKTKVKPQKKSNFKMN